MAADPAGLPAAVAVAVRAETLGADLEDLAVRVAGGRGNFDPAQFRQMMMDNIRDRLEATNDAEWQVLQPLVQKVMDARRSRSRRRSGRNGHDDGPPQQ